MEAAIFRDGAAIKDDRMMPETSTAPDSQPADAASVTCDDMQLIPHLHTFSVDEDDAFHGFAALPSSAFRFSDSPTLNTAITDSISHAHNLDGACFTDPDLMPTMTNHGNTDANQDDVPIASFARQVTDFGATGVEATGRRVNDRGTALFADTDAFPPLIDEAAAFELPDNGREAGLVTFLSNLPDPSMASDVNGNGQPIATLATRSQEVPATPVSKYEQLAQTPLQFLQYQHLGNTPMRETLSPRRTPVRPMLRLPESARQVPRSSHHPKKRSKVHGTSCASTPAQVFATSRYEDVLLGVARKYAPFEDTMMSVFLIVAYLLETNGSPGCHHSSKVKTAISKFKSFCAMRQWRSPAANKGLASDIMGSYADEWGPEFVGILSASKQHATSLTNKLRSMVKTSQKASAIQVSQPAKKPRRTRKRAMLDEDQPRYEHPQYTDMSLAVLYGLREGRLWSVTTKNNHGVQHILEHIYSLTIEERKQLWSELMEEEAAAVPSLDTACTM